MLISDRSRASLDDIFVRAARSNLVMDAGDPISVTPARSRHAEADQSGLYIITIASFQFRLLIAIDLPDTPAVVEYYSKASSNLGPHDVFPEVCNMCGGAVNRELARQFKHLGMSTPNLVERHCIEFLAVLRPVHTSSFDVVINDAVRLHAVIGLCVYTPVDILPQPPEEEAAGILELL